MSARSQPLNPPQPVTVSTLVRSIRDLLEHRYPLQWVRGEISNFIEAKSGHVYFVLKDAQAQVRCVMFRQRAQLLDWRPRDGMQVEIRALVTLYEPRGDFQLNVDSMRRAGVGALFEAFLRLRDQLDREGLFDAALKRALPAFPRCIGVALIQIDFAKPDQGRLDQRWIVVHLDHLLIKTAAFRSKSQSTMCFSNLQQQR